MHVIVLAHTSLSALRLAHLYKQCLEHTQWKKVGQAGFSEEALALSSLHWPQRLLALETGLSLVCSASGQS